MDDNLMVNPKETIEGLIEKLLLQMELTCCYLVSSSNVLDAAYVFHLRLGCRQSARYYDIDVAYSESQRIEEIIRLALIRQHGRPTQE